MNNIMDNDVAQHIVVTLQAQRENKPAQEIINLKNRKRSYMDFFATYYNLHPYMCISYNDTVPMLTWFIDRQYKGDCKFTKLM